MRQTQAALAASKHKTRYTTPQQPANSANGGRVLPACRLIRLSFRVAVDYRVPIDLFVYSPRLTFHTIGAGLLRE